MIILFYKKECLGYKHHPSLKHCRTTMAETAARATLFQLPVPVDRLTLNGYIYLLICPAVKPTVNSFRKRCIHSDEENRPEAISWKYILTDSRKKVDEGDAMSMIQGSRRCRRGRLWSLRMKASNPSELWKKNLYLEMLSMMEKRSEIHSRNRGIYCKFLFVSVICSSYPPPSHACKCAHTCTHTPCCAYNAW